MHKRLFRKSDSLRLCKLYSRQQSQRLPHSKLPYQKWRSLRLRRKLSSPRLQLHLQKTHRLDAGQIQSPAGRRSCRRYSQLPPCSQPPITHISLNRSNPLHSLGRIKLFAERRQGRSCSVSRIKIQCRPNQKNGRKRRLFRPLNFCLSSNCGNVIYSFYYIKI